MHHRGRTFHSSRSGTAYTGGVCSLTRGGGINEVRKLKWTYSFSHTNMDFVVFDRVRLAGFLTLKVQCVGFILTSSSEVAN